jgi:rod shape-determining protein MreC
MLKKTKKIPIFIISTFLILFLINRIFFFKQGVLENIASTFVYPVLVITNKIKEPLVSFFEKRKKHNQLFKRYNQLKKKYQHLMTENIKLHCMLKNYNLSKELINFQERYKLENGISAKIIGKNFSEVEHYFLVNKGSRDGITKDMVAIYKFQILGKITTVYPWYSKLKLITDRTCKVAAFTNTTEAHGIITGQGNKHSYCMDYVSHLEKISLEDFVISSGQGLIFPEGFCLGKVKNFSTEGIYHHITVEPLIPFDSHELKFCLIINQEKITSF